MDRSGIARADGTRVAGNGCQRFLSCTPLVASPCLLPPCSAGQDDAVRRQAPRPEVTPRAGDGLPAGPMEEGRTGRLFRPARPGSTHPGKDAMTAPSVRARPRIVPPLTLLIPLGCL